jgi:sugar phosphate isomerase/epimerase
MNLASRRTILKAAVATTAMAFADITSAAAEPAADRWPIGCYTRPWAAFDYPVALDAIAAAGFRYAGIMTVNNKGWASAQRTLDEAQTLAGEVRKRGLKSLSMYGDFSVTTSVEDGVTALKHLIDLCSVIACPNLLLGGTGNAKLYDAYYKTIAECCDYAQSKGVGMTIKPHGGQNATGPQCRKAIESVNHKSFRLWYDPGNVFFYSDGKLDPVEDSKTVDGLVVGMSIKDFLPPKEVAVTPGTGKVDFRAVMANLKKGGFTGGPLVIECLDKGDAAKLAADAVKARKFVEALVAGL